jgi:hypothetical protein
MHLLHIMLISLFCMSYVIYWKTLVAEKEVVSSHRYTYFDLRPVEAMDNLQTNIESPHPAPPSTLIFMTRGPSQLKQQFRQEQEPDRKRLCLHLKCPRQ